MSDHFYGDGCTPPHLPTRKQAKKHSGVEKHDTVSFPVLTAYVDGTLMTRQEFIDSLDIEAATKAAMKNLFRISRTNEAWSRTAEEMIAAALGKEQT